MPREYKNSQEILDISNEIGQEILLKLSGRGFSPFEGMLVTKIIADSFEDMASK